MQVYKGYLEGVQEVAIKVFAEQGTDHRLIARKKLLKEVALLKSCRSPSIVQVRWPLHYVYNLVLQFKSARLSDQILMNLAEMFPNRLHLREAISTFVTGLLLVEEWLFTVVQMGAHS